MKNLDNIILQCIRKDSEAQKLLYLAYKDRLMKVAYRYSKDINTAKDVLQNGFIKIFQHLDNYDRSKGRFDQWTYRIIVNEALAIKRKRKEIEIPRELDIGSYTELTTIGRLTVEELSIVINKLPEVHRIILNLYYFEEYTHKEIAEILGIKESSSRSQLSKSRKILHHKWAIYNKINIQ